MGLPYPFNKALLPLGTRSVLSRILDKFPPHTHFVIGLGYCGSQVRDFLLAAHPDRRFTFVEIEKISGGGSGPGQSILECAPHLMNPFYFVACDTLWQEDLPSACATSWVGVASAPARDPSAYCNVAMQGERVTALLEKGESLPAHTFPFIGLAYIHDPQNFFAGLRETEPEGELQISHGLSRLIEGGLKTVPFSWLDLGTREKYREACARFENFDFSKEEEFFFLGDQRVVKFFRNPEVVHQRVARAKLNTAVFPAITFSGEQFFAYDFVPGKTLYDSFSFEKFAQLLPWLEKNLWLEAVGRNGFTERCRNFYQEKTRQRMALWQKKHPQYREPEKVNGRPQPPLRALLESLPWSELIQGVPRFIHGDLQPDNILCAEKEFLLLDWRQDFAGALDHGDLYYDLAKLRGGLVVNYSFIKKGEWNYQETESDCNFSLPQIPEQEACLQKLEQFVEALGLSYQRVVTITGLIFANMAPLHSAPFDRLLWNLSRASLAQGRRQ